MEFRAQKGWGKYFFRVLRIEKKLPRPPINMIFREKRLKEKPREFIHLFVYWIHLNWNTENVSQVRVIWFADTVPTMKYFVENHSCTTGYFPNKILLSKGTTNAIRFQWILVYHRRRDRISIRALGHSKFLSGLHRITNNLTICSTMEILMTYDSNFWSAEISGLIKMMFRVRMMGIFRIEMRWRKRTNEA